MLQTETLITGLIESFNGRATSLPIGFYSTWEFTETGNNFSHPVTLGILITELGKLLPDCMASVDTRFNMDAKFQPDITMLDTELNPVLFLDYESPNSSDARIPIKDIDAYNAFSQSTQTRIPYLVVTSLPDLATPKWQLRYYSPGYYNAGFKQHISAIRENPFRFWYSHYRSEMTHRNSIGIHFLNIQGKEMHLVQLSQYA